MIYEKKVFLYCRDSLGNKKRIEDQEKILKDYVRYNLGDEVDVITYKDFCGLSENRVGLNNLLKDLKTEKVEWVIATNSNRFYRLNYENGEKQLINIMQDIINNGAGVVFTSECVRIQEEEQIREYVKLLKKFLIKRR